MSTTFSTTHRNPSRTSRSRPAGPASLLPTTPTVRILEITCGLSQGQVESLLAVRSSRGLDAFPDRPSALNAYQAFGVVTCCLLLSAIVAALIISLG